ncbi:hypothetical protein ACQZ5N_18805 [Agrobacterium sp. 22-221-1]
MDTHIVVLSAVHYGLVSPARVTSNEHSRTPLLRLSERLARLYKLGKMLPGQLLPNPELSMNWENALRQIDPNPSVVCHAAILSLVGFNPVILWQNVPWVEWQPRHLFNGATLMEG